MITENYFKVAEIAKKHKVTTRTVRNKIKLLIGLVSDNKIFMDNNREYRIHKSLLKKFEPIRVHKVKYIAISLDPVDEFKAEDLKKTMVWILENISVDEVRIDYSIERKKANGRNHLHIYTKKSVIAKFIKSCKTAFPFMSYHLIKVYDLTGWKNYIGKESEIITLKK